MLPTFFATLATLLHEETQGWSALLMHKKLMMHFSQIVFSNASSYNSIAELLKAKHDLVLNKTCILHPAIKLWIERVHAKELHFHKTPEDWFKAYPKLLKGLALRFIYYHRDYEAKPYRLFDRHVFCQLASEVFCCKIGLVDVEALPQPPPPPRSGGGGGASLSPPSSPPPLRGGGGDLKIRWFYPLETADYYLKLDIPVIILEYHGHGQFKPKTESIFLEQEDNFQLEHIKEPNNMISNNMRAFCLRRYTVEDLQNQKREHTNFPVGNFDAVAKNVFVILFQPMPSAGECCYQVYPGNPNKTCYTLGPGETLHVFSINKRNQISLCGETSEADVYLYFNLQPKEHVGAVAVVCAGGKRAAEDAVLNSTKFILQNISTDE